MVRVGVNSEKMPSVIIPCLSEPYLPKLLGVLEGFETHVQGEKGLSFAVAKGIEASTTSVVVVMDGDGSHPAEAIFPMVDLLDSETWFVVGSRYCKGGISHDSFVRQFVSRIYCLVAQVVLRTSLHDPMSGFWAGYREFFDFVPDIGFKFGLQLIRKYRGHIKEFPIVFHKRQNGKSHVKLRQALMDFWAIFRSARN